MGKMSWTESLAASLPREERENYTEFLRYEAMYADLVTQMRVLLSSKGVSQKELAERMGTSESAVSRLLNASQVRNLKVETLVRFAKALGVGLQDTFFDDPVLDALLSRSREADVVAAVDRRAATRGDGPRRHLRLLPGGQSDSARLLADLPGASSRGANRSAPNESAA